MVMPSPRPDPPPEMSPDEMEWYHHEDEITVAVTSGITNTITCMSSSTARIPLTPLSSFYMDRGSNESKTPPKWHSPSATNQGDVCPGGLRVKNLLVDYPVDSDSEEYIRSPSPKREKSRSGLWLPSRNSVSTASDDAIGPNATHSSYPSTQRTTTYDEMLHEIERQQLEIDELKFQLNMQDKEMKLEREIAREDFERRIKELEDHLQKVTARQKTTEDDVNGIISEEVDSMGNLLQRMLAAQLPASLLDSPPRGEVSPREAQRGEWAVLSSFFLNLDSTCRSLVQMLEDKQVESEEKSAQIDLLASKLQQYQSQSNTLRKPAAPSRTNTPPELPRRQSSGSSGKIYGAAYPLPCGTSPLPCGTSPTYTTEAAERRNTSLGVFSQRISHLLGFGR